ncbi:MAG: divalent metal cation transporter, partial [Nitrospirota bacterium]
ISVPLGAFFIWLLVVKGSYKSIERIFLAGCLVYLTYIISAVMARPDWTEVAVTMIRPSANFDSSYFLMIVGLVGTTVTPWMQFYLQSSIVEKGVRKEDYWASRIDVIAGSIMMHIVAFFIVVACGATLFKTGVKINGAEEAALALKPFAGDYASILFAIGLANASLFAASILPLATAYYICQAMGWETGVDKTFKEAPQFIGIYSALILMGSLIILIPGAPLMPIMWMSQVLNGVMLPFVLIFILRLVNDAELMGSYTNTKSLNWIAWSTTVIIIGLNAVMVITVFLRL